MTERHCQLRTDFFARVREKHFHRTALVASVTLAFGATFDLSRPARAQWAVYDGANHVQNVLIAARTLQQIDNQITSLANQAQMLVNQGRNLASCHCRHCRRCNQRFPRQQPCSRRHRTSLIR